MDLLKNLVFIAALAVVAGGVYILLTNNPQIKTPQGYEGWSSQGAAPKIEMPTLPGGNSSLPNSGPSVGGPWAGPAPQSPFGSAPSTNPIGGEAPPFRSNPPPASIPGGEAPRFGAAASHGNPTMSGSPFPSVSPSMPAGPADPTAPGSAPAWASSSPPSASSAGVSPPTVPSVPSTGLAGLPAPPTTTDPAATASPMVASNPNPVGPSGIRSEFATFIEAAKRKLDAGGWAEVYQSMSRLYANPHLTPEEDRQLTEMLDHIAGIVIYSRQSILEQPYVVQPGETLPQIAQKCEVSWELLAKINGIRDPDHLTPGQELKVVHGPFKAVIRLDRHELTMMLPDRMKPDGQNDRYAGRFPIGIGQDRPIRTGTHLVRNKWINPTYYGNGQTVDRNDPNNPLGERLLDLGGQVSIHGTNDPQSIGRTGGLGSIRLSQRDIDDVYDILTLGSQVVIER